MTLEIDLRPHFKRYIDPRFESMVQLNIEPEVRDEIYDLMAKGGRPILYANHQGHGDGWPLGMAVRYLKSFAKEAGADFPGAILPLARSMFTGHQGLPLKILTELSVPILEEKGFRIIPYTRNKDFTNFGLKKSLSEVKNMVRAVREGYGFCYLPEASIQGGRHKNLLGFVLGGERYGVIKPDDIDGFSGFYNLLEREGNVKGEIFFLPIALEGSYRFFGADLPIPTMELLQGLFKDSDNPIQATIERPVTRAKLPKDWQTNGAGLNNFLMTQVVRKLSPESRGIYKDVAA